MSTMADAEDALLQGKARFLEWFEEFNQKWNLPLTDTLAGSMWAGIDGPTKDALAERIPGAVKNMNTNYGGRNGTLPLPVEAGAEAGQQPQRQIPLSQRYRR